MSLDVKAVPPGLYIIQLNPVLSASVRSTAHVVVPCAVWVSSGIWIQVIPSVNLTLHPSYDGAFGNGYDVALLKLDRNSSKALAFLGSVSDGEDVTALGWAVVTASGPLPPVLQRTDNMTVSIEECVTIYKVGSCWADWIAVWEVGMTPIQLWKGLLFENVNVGDRCGKWPIWYQQSYDSVLFTTFDCDLYNVRMVLNQTFLMLMR